MSDNRTIELKHPIKVRGDDGAMHDKQFLTLQRLKAKHLKLIPKSLYVDKGSKKKGPDIEPHEILPLLAGLTGITEEEIGELDVADLMHAAEQLTDFLSESLPGA
jgi:hypothetical protein